MEVDLENNLEQLVNFVPGYVCVKDLNHKYVIADSATARLAGFSSIDQMQGKRDEDLRCSAAMLAEEYIKSDLVTLSLNQETHWIFITSYANNEDIIMHGTKKPLYNKSGDIFGLLLVMTPIERCLDMAYRFSHEVHAYDHHAFDKKNSAYQITNTIPNTFLTPREAQCYFYLMRGKKLKEIAALLSLSPRTIESYFGNIKNKFNCSHLSQLKDIAIDRGYTNIILKQLYKGKNLMLDIN